MAQKLDHKGSGDNVAGNKYVDCSFNSEDRSQKKILDKVKSLTKDNIIKSQDNSADFIYLDSDDIFLTIRETTISGFEELNPWIPDRWYSSPLMDNQIYQKQFEFLYNGIKIHTEFLLSIDGGRAYVPIKNAGSHTINKSAYNFAILMNQVWDNDPSYYESYIKELNAEICDYKETTSRAVGAEKI